MRALALLPLLLLLMATFVMPYARAEERLEIVSAFWGTAEQPIDVRPGDEKVPLSLVIQNKYSYVIIGIYAELTLPRGFHNITGGDRASAAFGPSLPPGGVGTLTFLIDIDDEVRSGNYTFHLKVDFFDSVYSEMEEEYSFSLKVGPAPRLEVSSYGWGSPEQPLKPVPGTEGLPLYVWITNPENYPVYGLNLTLSLPPGVSSPEGGDRVWATIPLIEAGQSSMATFIVDLDESAPPGEATFRLNYEFLDAWSAKYSGNESFSLPIYPENEIRIISDDISLEQGTSVKFDVLLSNLGSAPVYDLLPSIKAEGLVVLDSPVNKLDILRPGENATFEFEVYAPSNLPPSSIPVLLTVSYKGANGLPVAESKVIGADVLAPTRAIEITPSTTEINYQRLNEVILEVKNRSDGPVYDVELSLTPPSALPLYVEEGVGPWNFSLIEPGSTRQVVLHVLPFTQMEGVAVITATVTYRDGDATKTETQALLFYLKGYSDITLVNWKLSPDPTYNGSRVSLSASLLNRGTQQAYYTRVYLKAEGPFLLDRMSDKYIGDLPTNSPTPFSLQFDVMPDAKPGKYKLEVIVEYTDTLGQKHEVSWPLELEVRTGHPSTIMQETQQIQWMDRDLMVIIGLSVLLIIAVIWGYRRGRAGEEIEAV